MTSPTLNIGWNKYEVVLLVDAYQRYLQEEWSRKDAVAILSKRLRARMQRLGSAVSETYRNENGISMQMSAIEYLFTDGQKGISHVSTLFREVFKMFNEERNSYDEMLKIAEFMYPIEPQLTNGHFEQASKMKANTIREGSICGLKLPNGETIAVKLERYGEDTATIRTKGWNRYSVPAYMITASSERKPTLPKWFQEGSRLSNGDTIAEIDRTYVTLSSGKVLRHIDVLLGNIGEHVDTPTEDAFYEEPATSAQESLTDWYAVEKIKLVLKEKFPRGYRLNSFVETQRMKSFYQELHGEVLDMSDNDIDANARICGIENEGRIYLPELMLSGELRDNLINYLHETFEQGTQCIYYSVLYDTFHEQFLDYQILSPHMLRQYLESTNNEGWRFWTDYMTDGQFAETNIQQEVEEFVREHGGVVSKEEVVKGLPLLPPSEVENAFVAAPTILISCGRNQRFHIDNFAITDEEVNIVESIIDKAISNYHYISFGELLEDMRLQTHSLLDNNENFTEIGIRKVLEIKLGDRFKFTNNIISSNSEPISTEDVFYRLAEKENYTIDEVVRLAADCDTLANVWIGYLFNYSVRVNKNDFVECHHVHFDITATDNVLAKLCPSEYVSLRDITLFTALPDCGYPWNEYLLECYVACYSKQFTLLHGRYFGKKAVGAIVKKSSGINDFSELLIQVIDKAGVPLNKKSALDFLFDNGYIAQRRYDEIDDVLSQIKKNKNKK